ncbi:N-terminal nucleophile aminohydrolase [Schizopora paradoxa]|uniref:N-terminal nucleophile aminohydrolase n=1 Tax=Schizopora paradoxa TaxID=27342 RepID=A0A0H2RZC8_9AGAM|nr:N-terminal nucleophile aminohydrolase [Schizopora paradoxa]
MQVIAVHGGAGYHSKQSEKVVKHALRSACSKALSNLAKDVQNDRKPVTAVGEAIVVLEDDGCLNAGYGSNLTMDGEVECDASIMEGTTEYFGSVGAVTGVKNPIRLASAILENASRPQSLGRVPPIMLVGEGASAFARELRQEIVHPAELKTDESIRNWRTWKERLERTRESGALESTNTLTSSVDSNYSGLDDSESHLEDTVGAVAISNSGMAAGVSSGGLLLKYPGRVGEAAIFGAGCFALSPAGNDFGVACSVSGTGEAIIRSSLAKTLCDAVSSSPDDIHEAIERTLKDFSRKYVEDPGVVAGALILTRQFEGEPGPYDCRLWCAFTSQSMAIGYASDKGHKPRAFVLRQAESSTPKLFITCFSLKSS